VLADGAPAWVAACGLGAAFGFALWRHPPVGLSTALREAGVGLELFGLGLVAYGLRDIRRQFGRPSALASAREWVERSVVALGPPQPIVLSAKGAALATSGGSAILDFGTSKDAPLERRVEILERRLDVYRDEMRGSANELKQKVGDVSRRLDAQAQEQREASKQLEDRLEQSAVGGLHLEVVGLVWLFVGTVCSGLGDEVAWLVSRW
jgi:hypothetical protein